MNKRVGPGQCDECALPALKSPLCCTALWKTRENPFMMRLLREATSKAALSQRVHYTYISLMINLRRYSCFLCVWIAFVRGHELPRAKPKPFSSRCPKINWRWSKLNPICFSFKLCDAIIIIALEWRGGKRTMTHRVCLSVWCSIIQFKGYKFHVIRGSMCMYTSARTI